jgi:hypothetical protein
VYKIRLLLYLIANFVITSATYYEMDRDGELILDLLDNISYFLDRAGQFLEVFMLQSFRLNQLKRLFGEKDVRMISAMNNLASTLGNQGKLDEAASMRQEVLEKMNRILGEEHPNTTSAMNNLANTLRE